jgi:hypothetical protein
MAKRGVRRGKENGGLLMKSAEMIGWALGGLEREILATRERLSALAAQASELRARRDRLSGNSAAAGASPGRAAGRPRRRKLSPEARQRISEAATRRWAERRAGKTGGKGAAAKS